MSEVTYETGDELGRARRPEREGIPVGDNANGSVYTVTIDEETGERVMVVDMRAFTRLMGDAGGLEIRLTDFDPFLTMSAECWGDPFVKFRADIVLNEVIGALKSEDTVTIFKWGGSNAEG